MESQILPKQDQQSRRDSDYKKVVAENKRLKEQIVKCKKELQLLKNFIGIGEVE